MVSLGAGLSCAAASDAFDLSDRCIRGYWATLVPALFVLALCLHYQPHSIPLPPFRLRKALYMVKKTFTPYISLQEAEALLLDDEAVDLDDTMTLGNDDATTNTEGRQGSTLILTLSGFLECLVWLATGCFLLMAHPESRWHAIQHLLTASTWLYAALRPLLTRPSAHPPYDLLALYILHLLGAFVQLGGYVFDVYTSLGQSLSLRTLADLSLNIFVLLGLMSVVLRMPMAVPSSKERGRPNVSPEDYTSLWGWVSFSWVYPLIELGRNTTLNESDVWDLSPTIRSRPIFIKFSALPQNLSLLAKLWAANSFDVSMDFLLTIMSILFNYAEPFFLKRILDCLDTSTNTSPDMQKRTQSKAFVYAILMFVCSLMKAQCEVQHLWLGRRACTRIRSELMAAIYDKTLKRRDYSGVVDEQNAAGKEEAGGQKTTESKAGANTGKIVNLMAVDANQVAYLASMLNFLYSAPLELTIASILLYNLLGVSAFSGFLLILIFGWPLNSFFSKRSLLIHGGLLRAQDRRMGVLTELIGAVKIIKFFAWERRWIDRALEAREEELRLLRKGRINEIGFSFLWVTMPIFISVFSFFTYVMLGNQLTISTAFTAIALFNMIRQPLNGLPNFVVQLLKTRVSLDRISVFLKEEEVPEQVSSLKKDYSSPASAFASELQDERLGLEHASFRWNPVEQSADVRGVTVQQNGNSPSETNSATAAPSQDEENVADHRFELKNLSIVFPRGELTVVTGPTASGKTALLLAVMGEMTSLPGGRILMSKNPGKLDAYGNMQIISYAAQTPWLRHQSIKVNILFGFPFDEARYNAVIDCCALRPDLDILEDGDDTEIGERGITLSGGQKARVALARAVYAKTQYVLLDDPLSAVDSHTSQILYEKCLRGPLLANRTVVLVTHHIELVLPGAHYLVRMLDGRIDAQGTVQELRAQGVLDDIRHDAAIEVQKEEKSAEVIEADANPVEEKKAPRALVQDEKRQQGGVKWEIYKSYLRASSYSIWSVMAFLIVVVQLLGIGEKFWMKTWGEAYKISHNASAVHAQLVFAQQTPMASQIYTPPSSAPTVAFVDWPSAVQHPLFYVGIHAAIALSTAFVNISSSILQIRASLKASRNLFKALLVSVVHATFRFHDTTPQGRMINRFADMEYIDVWLAGALQQVNLSLAGFFGALFTVIAVFPIFVIPGLIIGWFYYIDSTAYLATGRDLKRMESNFQSPIYSDFGELLNGIVTIRAFSVELRFLTNIHTRIDKTTKMWYTYWMTNRWLLLNFDFLGSMAVFFTTMFSVYSFVGNAGLAGLAITSALNFSASVFSACRAYTTLEGNLNCVERVVEYLGLPQEPPAINEHYRPPAYWPSSANNDSLIVAENLSVKYAPDLPSVLQDVSFRLKAGERVGLLGRTGSGKSTLAMSVLRFADPSSGRIIVDGVDISKIGLEDLRSRLTFIPQDATLFSGSLRDNLDPFGEHDDATCSDVLRRVQMITDNSSVAREQSPTGYDDDGEPEESTATVSLDTQVSAGGANFSQGQRQLIAMARALLRHSSIVIMDEATSSVDFKTDAKIQATIREEFTDSLLITIAHRLKTIIDYDRLLVLDKGKLVEFDTPSRLIQKEDGFFRNMCLRSGYFEELEAAALGKAEQM
ncbi:hypothetical protein R3P38DRAFT_3040178 [Favolaschia claudopus]|uniref:Uncharacterized protein n=1 Tax=Favolaschia claudopus TaxID=2862362 RepID=A0AAW0AAM8_9AGAR